MAEKNIIGREQELQILNDVIKSKKAEFVAVYGRRRVGKTFLIREYFKSKGLFLEITGVKNISLREQLDNFASGISKTFFNNYRIQSKTSWKDAFEELTSLVKNVPKRKKVIVFLDELPWLASKRSGLMSALDYYWNRYWSQIPNLILITCGSAASWMLEHVIQAKGGLYNRLTKRILLEPFSLKETKKFLKSRGINLSNRQVLDIYMVIGGIPYYLNEIKKGISATQNINNLCFKKNGLLFHEFENIFRSLFDHSEIHLQIVREIAKQGAISREDLIEAAKLASGGTLNQRLDELEASGFIRTFMPLGKIKRDRFYRIIDEYTLFYLRWIEPIIRTGTYSEKQGYWQKINKHPNRLGWAGFAFESVCYKHISQIIGALSLEEITFTSGSWLYRPPKKSAEFGAQVDLLIDRDDDTIMLCEMKYCDHMYSIDKSYAKSLLHKVDIVESYYPTKWKPSKKQIFLAMITTFGLKANIYSEDLVQHEITLDDLFL